MKRTILIVDDSNVERIVLTGFLKEEYNIIEADSGEKAIDALQENFRRISAIVMDIAAPEMKGLGVLKKIKAHADRTQIPVIVTTDLGDEDTREKAIAYGANNYIIRPYNPTLLQHIIKNAIRLCETTSLNETVHDILAHNNKLTKQLHILADSIPGGIATFQCTDEEVLLQYYNEGLCHLSGYTKEEYEGMHIDPLNSVFDEDKSVLCNQIKEMIKDGAPVDCDVRIHTKGGGYKWVSCKACAAHSMENGIVANAVLTDSTRQQEERERLRVSEELNRIAIKHSGNIITRFDVASRTLTLPDSFTPIFEVPHVLENMPEEQIELGRVSPDTAHIYRKLFEDIIKGEKTGTATYKQNSTKGWRWLEAHFTTVFSNDGEPVSAVISFADITERMEKEVIYNKWQQSLEERPEESYTLFRCNLSKGSSYESREGRLLGTDFDNRELTFEERTAEYVEKYVYELDRDKYLAFLNTDTMLADYYRGHRANYLEYRELCSDGVIHWLGFTVDMVEYPNSHDVEVYMMYEDIDEEKKADLLTIERAEKDSLTGVFNRATFISRMEKVLTESKLGTKHALLMLDVDNFKNVNDTMGHDSGDQVLKDLTARLSSVLRHNDIIGRLGGDEFFVFIKDLPNKEAAVTKARQICGLGISVENSHINITVSVGIAMIPENGSDFDTLYRKVDCALYQQKANGKNGYMLVAE